MEISSLNIFMRRRRYKNLITSFNDLMNDLFKECLPKDIAKLALSKEKSKNYIKCLNDMESKPKIYLKQKKEYQKKLKEILFSVFF